MRHFDFYLPPRLVFGAGRIRDIDELLDGDLRRVLVVTDEGVVQKSSAVDALLEAFKDRETIVFSDIEENPAFDVLEAGRRLAVDGRVQVVVGIGGGSPMDAAKGIAVLATNAQDMRHFMGGGVLESDPLPIVCIPTTSGTGSEATPYAVFTDRDAETKGGFAHPKIFPRLSVVDPELTYSMPELLIINTGLDALTHAVEAYLSILAFPLSDLYALESIRTILDSLGGAVKKDRGAMGRMAYASMLAGVAITHGGTILLHIMGYPLTVFHGIHHGRANAILLPAFLRFMRDASTVKEKLDVVDGLFQAVGGVEAFVAGFGVSTRLSDYGVEEGEFDLFAKKVIVKGDVEITPAEVTEGTIAELYRSTM